MEMKVFAKSFKSANLQKIDVFFCFFFIAVKRQTTYWKCC